MNYEKSLIKVINEPRLKPKAIKQDIFNLTHLYENSDYENIYLFSKTTYIALMFYLRNIRNIGDMGDITRGRGERYLSYTMALWLLRRDPDLFDKNIYLFGPISLSILSNDLTKSFILNQCSSSTFVVFGKNKLPLL